MNKIRLKEMSQRAFLNTVITNSNSPSLRSLLQFGISVTYTSLKNYYNERRLIPERLFDELCVLGNIDKSTINYEIVKQHWGQVKGGKKSKRGKLLNIKK